MNTVRYPELRLEVISALESLSDLEYQKNCWGKYEEGVQYYDDLTLNVHILYDDVEILPDPASAVPEVIFPSEVPFFRDLGTALGPLIRDLGDAADRTYIADPRWQAVLDSAQAALIAMRESDDDEYL